MALQPMTPGTLQIFNSVLPELDPGVRAYLEDGGCCGAGTPYSFDRFSNPVNAEWKHDHTQPGVFREYFRFGSNEQIAVNEAVYDHINDSGTNTSIEIMTIPSFAAIVSFAVTVYAMDAGLSLKLNWRNGLTFPGSGLKFQVPAGACQPDISQAVAQTSALQALVAPAAGNAAETFLFTAPGGLAYTGNGDVLKVGVAAMPGSGIVSNIDMTISLVYAVAERLYRR